MVLSEMRSWKTVSGYNDVVLQHSGNDMVVVC